MTDHQNEPSSESSSESSGESQDTEVKQLSARQTWQWLIDNPDAILVDVRTHHEWATVGIPDLTSLAKRPLMISWLIEPGKPNPNFMTELTNAITHETPVAFLCKGGARSQAAAQAAISAGYRDVVNIVSGFEGGAPVHEPDKTGWIASALPTTTIP